MLFISPYKNYRQPIHKGIAKRYHPVTGDVLEWEVRPLAAVFGMLGDEQLVYNPLTQTHELVADIVTGVYDTDIAAQKEGWNETEREIVEKALEDAAERTPLFVRKLTPVHVAAPAPWQTYDSTAPDKIVALAAELGLIPEALRYERENAARETILAGLTAALAPEDAGRAKPLEKIDIPVEKPAMKIAKAPKTTRSGIVVETTGLELREGVEVVEQPEQVPGAVTV